MNSRTFFFLSLCLFCAVLIVIPFWAQYFKVTGVDGRVIEWLQVLAGFSALAIGSVTLYFVTIQLTMADDQLTKANEQLVKADVQINLANKQLELADAQLALARKDSAMLTLQLRASACAAIETDLLLVDQTLHYLSSPEMRAIRNAFSQMKDKHSVVNYGGQVRRQAQKLLPALAQLESNVSNNVEPVIAHLSDKICKRRESFTNPLSRFVVYIRDCSNISGDKLDQSTVEMLETCATNYLVELQTAERSYKSLLDEAKRIVESE